MHAGDGMAGVLADYVTVQAGLDHVVHHASAKVMYPAPPLLDLFSEWLHVFSEYRFWPRPPATQLEGAEILVSGLERT